jgi:hypothetical protein
VKSKDRYAPCTTLRPSFSKDRGEPIVTGWRCKKIKECVYCREIEESKQRLIMGKKPAIIYLIEEKKWNGYQKKLARKNEDYLRIPQKDGMVAVYTNVPPNCEHTILKRLTGEQLLANRLDDGVRGLSTGTGIFAKEKREKAEKDRLEEIVTITVPTPMFRYKESGKIMPFLEEVLEFRVDGYIYSPCTTITKDNAEEHLEFVFDWTAQATKDLFGDKIEVLFMDTEIEVPVSNFDNWVDGVDIKPSGRKNSHSDPRYRQIEDRKLGKTELFGWYKHLKAQGDKYKYEPKKNDDGPGSWEYAQKEMTEHDAVLEGIMPRVGSRS